MSGIPGRSAPWGLGRGATGPIGPTGPTGPTGPSVSIFQYRANTGATIGYPGNGDIIWNNATQINSTSISVSHLTDDGTDIDVILALLEAGQDVLIQDQNDSNNYQSWHIGVPVNINPGAANSYWQIPVTLVASGGTGTTNFPNNHQLFIDIVRVGPIGPTGPQGPAGSSVEFDPTTTYTVSQLSIFGGIVQTDAWCFVPYADTTWSGADFLWDRAGDNVLVKLWRASDGAVLSSGAVVSVAGANAVPRAPVAIAKGIAYYVSMSCAAARLVYIDPAAKLWFPMFTAATAPSPTPNGPNYYVVSCSSFGAGDANPTSYSSTAQYPIRPRVP